MKYSLSRTRLIACAAFLILGGIAIFNCEYYRQSDIALEEAEGILHIRFPHSAAREVKKYEFGTLGYTDRIVIVVHIGSKVDFELWDQSENIGFKKIVGRVNLVLSGGQQANVSDGYVYNTATKGVANARTYVYDLQTGYCFMQLQY